MLRAEAPKAERGAVPGPKAAELLADRAFPEFLEVEGFRQHQLESTEEKARKFQAAPP